MQLHLYHVVLALKKCGFIKSFTNFFYFRNFSCTETLCMEHKYFCEVCGSKQEAQKRYTFTVTFYYHYYDLFSLCLYMFPIKIQKRDSAVPSIPIWNFNYKEWIFKSVWRKTSFLLKNIQNSYIFFCQPEFSLSIPWNTVHYQIIFVPCENLNKKLIQNS